MSLNFDYATSAAVIHPWARIPPEEGLEYHSFLLTEYVLYISLFFIYSWKDIAKILYFT